MSLVRVQQISVSLDGFATGEGQSREAPFGHAGERLHEWMFATQWGRAMLGESGGSRKYPSSPRSAHGHGTFVYDCSWKSSSTRPASRIAVSTSLNA